MRCFVLVLALRGTAAAGSAPDMALARGQALLAGGDRDEAVAVFDELVERFPGSPRAAEAAMLALETLNRQCCFEEEIAHVDRYISNRTLLHHRELAHQLRAIYLRCCMRRDTPPPRVDYEREAFDRLEEFAANPQGAYSDELLYEAGWQFCISHHRDAAARAWRVLLALLPHSELAARAELGLADLATCDG